MSAGKKLVLLILLAVLLFSLFACGVSHATIQQWKSDSDANEKAREDARKADEDAAQRQNDLLRKSLP